MNSKSKTMGKRPKKQKVYRAYWNPGTFQVEEGREIQHIGDSHINVRNGYRAEEVEEVQELDVGERWYSMDYGEDHWIERIK